jgi:hypothetical protein
VENSAIATKSHSQLIASVAVQIALSSSVEGPALVADALDRLVIDEQLELRGSELDLGVCVAARDPPPDVVSMDEAADPTVALLLELSRPLDALAGRAFGIRRQLIDALEPAVGVVMEREAIAEGPLRLDGDDVAVRDSKRVTPLRPGPS